MAGHPLDRDMEPASTEEIRALLARAKPSDLGSLGGGPCYQLIVRSALSQSKGSAAQRRWHATACFSRRCGKQFTHQPAYKMGVRLSPNLPGGRRANRFTPAERPSEGDERTIDQGLRGRHSGLSGNLSSCPRLILTSPHHTRAQNPDVTTASRRASSPIAR